MKIPAANMNVGTFAVGAGIAFLSPMVIPLIEGILRPVTQNVIKDSLLVYDKSKTAVIEARESIEGMSAEAKEKPKALAAEAKSAAAADEPVKKKAAAA